MGKMRWVIPVIGLIFLIGWGKSDLQAGKDYFRANQPAKAIKSFTKAIQPNPQNQEAYFFRGATFSAIGQFNPAIADYTKTMEINPQHKEAYWSRGYCYANLEKFDEAITDYTKSLELGTAMKALVYESRAKVYFRKSMLNEAEADINSALQIDPNNPSAQARLKEVQKAKATPYFNPSALKFRPIEEQPQYGGIPPTPEQQQIHNQFIQEVVKTNGTKELACEEALKLAWQYFQQGDYRTAMKRFNQAWLLDPKNPEVFRGYAKILRVWGYNQEAEQWEQKTAHLQQPP